LEGDALVGVRHRLLGAVVVLGLTSSVVMSADVLPASARGHDPLLTVKASGLDWRTCHGGAECATLRVPLDYAHPNKKTIKLALLRIRASDRARRIGSLLVNPGGPGGSGLMLPFEFRGTPVAASFDVVGFDPRGVGDSTAISCGQPSRGTTASISPSATRVW
jgi:hypothetical protein